MKILGVKLDNLSPEEIIEKIEGFLSGGEQRYLVTPNPEFLVEAQKDQEFKKILNRAALSVADGVGLVLASRFLGRPLPKRLAGVDLMELICQRAAAKNWPVCFYGGQEGVAEMAADKLMKRYPGLQVESKNPKVLFVALGATKQEKWIAANLSKLPSVKLALGVGGAFDFISGRVRRAPKFVRTAGLEWLWRFLLEPWRAKRVFRAVAVFPWLVLKEKLSTRK